LPAVAEVKAPVAGLSAPVNGRRSRLVLARVWHRLISHGPTPPWEPASGPGTLSGIEPDLLLTIERHGCWRSLTQVSGSTQIGHSQPRPVWLLHF